MAKKKTTERVTKKPAVKKPAPARKPRPAATPKPPAPAAKKRAAPRVSKEPSLHIVMVASEAHPFAKTGGLAEVVGSLPDALVRLGHRVTVFVPRYRAVEEAGVVKQTLNAEISLGDRREEVTFEARELPSGVTAVLVVAPHLFERDGLYGTASGDYPDNAQRFAVFSRAAIEYLRLTETRPDIMHIHDWQAGLVPAYQKMLYSNDPFVGGVPVVCTIHNLAFQGSFARHVIPEVGLPWDVFHHNAMEHWGDISYLKAGVNFSERITTVSPRYAAEILTPQFGFGFEGVLARRRGDLIGILNGIDTERWNPANDPFVGEPYDARNLEGKRRAKEKLLRRVGLPVDLDRPLIGLISRLTDQKGFGLIADAGDELMQLDAAWVMLGSGEPPYEELWRSVAAKLPQQVSATIGFDEEFAHLIEAGSDMFLMPSRFEPCGLNQMYSLRYGTVPIVRAVGGLDDTVEDYDPATGRGTGFKFPEYRPEALVGAVRRALDLFRNRDAWIKVQKAGMQLDYSWDASAREYVKVYRGLLGPRATSQE